MQRPVTGKEAVSWPPGGASYVVLSKKNVFQVVKMPSIRG